MSKYSFPVSTRIAQKFFWEVFLTEKWDHLFTKEYELPCLPRNISFSPSEIVVVDIKRDFAGCTPESLQDVRVISFKDTETNSEVLVILLKMVSGTDVVNRISWVIESVCINFPSHSFVVGPVPIWEKK